MNTNRPCICGCPFEDHAVISFKDNKPSIYYCRLHVTKPSFWCTMYTPIDNLKYLELMSQKDEK